jgi:hypothetical protein
VLGKVMERISTDYEELKRVFESQKCPKDDKILALRKTARSVALKEQSHKIIVLGMTARSDILGYSHARFLSSGRQPSQGSVLVLSKTVGSAD